MGIVSFGIPKDIAIYLKENGSILNFIETGTFKGDTAIWASETFDKVITIEYSEEIYKETNKKLNNVSNIEFYFGDSRKELPKIVSNLNDPALFWLDAHWCSFGSYGENDQCPIIEELQIIMASNIKHFVMIDDARLFLSPPPLPNSTMYYPEIAEIIKVIGDDYFIAVYEDVIYAIPKSARDKFIVELQRKSTLKWQNEKERVKNEIIRRKSKLRNTVRLAKQILKIWIK